jgi:hypothetical protein
MLQSSVSEDPNPITFKEQDGMDFAATTVKLPDGEYVPWRTRWPVGDRGEFGVGDVYLEER